MINARDKQSALLITTLSSFLTPFAASSVNIALPSIAREFSMDAISLSWVATAYLLAAAMFLVPVGRFADIHGRKKVFLWGVGIYTVAASLIVFSPSSAFLIGFRVVQGFGATMMFGTSTAVLTSLFPIGERGRAIGITVAAVYLGLSTGPVFGGFLTQALGWRSLFLINIPIGILIFVVTRWRLTGEWAEAAGERFDVLGSAMYSLSLVALLYGFSQLPSAVGIACVIVGVLSVAAFLQLESRSASPILNVRAFRHNTPFVFSNLAALVNYSATFAVTFLLSLYLQYIKGLTPAHAGSILIAQPLVMAAVSPLAGKLSDRIEPQKVASIGMALTTAGLAILIFVGSTTPLTYIVAGLLVLGLGFALFSSPNTNAVMSSVEKKYYGVASATLGTMRLAGQMLSMGLATLIFSLLIGPVQIAPEHYGPFVRSVQVAFALFTVLCFAGIFISLARGRIHDNRPLGT